MSETKGTSMLDECARTMIGELQREIESLKAAAPKGVSEARVREICDGKAEGWRMYWQQKDARIPEAWRREVEQIASAATSRSYSVRRLEESNEKLAAKVQALEKAVADSAAIIDALRVLVSPPTARKKPLRKARPA